MLGLRLLLSLLLIAIAVPTAAAAGGRRAPAPVEVTPAELGWPATTRSVRTKLAAKVRSTPDRRGERRGKVAAGQRLAWRRVVKTADRCRAWVELADGGWVCGREVAPSDDAPRTATLPRKIRTGTSYAGIDLAASPPPSWPFAWALEGSPRRRRQRLDPRARTKPVAVRDAPRRDARRIDELAARTVVAVLEVDGDFVRIGPGRWVARRDLRLAQARPRPDGVGPRERWIDVDLVEQVLVAYDGDTPAYAALVSTGRGRGTPTGTYRIERKHASARMRDSADPATSRWDHPDVPFVLRFRKRFALHGAYWHDRFGDAFSVGCVNLAPTDAGWLSAWTEPALPPGWLEVRAPEGSGTAVRIRGPHDPEPAWRDYDGAVRARD